MSASECTLRSDCRKAIIRTRIVPFAATIVGLFALTDAQAAAGPNFYDYLEQGYREIAEYAVSRAGDSDIAQRFSGKARLAAAEHTVAPDMPMAMALPQNVRNEMMTAREKLTSALVAGARETAPRTAAVAQVNYDCWLAQFKGGGQTGSEDCRLLFYRAMAQLPSPPPSLVDREVSTDGVPVAASGDTAISALNCAPRDLVCDPLAAVVVDPVAAVGGPVDDLGATVDDAADQVSDTVGDATDTVSDTAGDAADTVGDAAGGALGGGGAVGGGGALGGGGLGGL